MTCAERRHPITVFVANGIRTCECGRNSVARCGVCLRDSRRISGPVLSAYLEVYRLRHLERTEQHELCNPAVENKLEDPFEAYL